MEPPLIYLDNCCFNRPYDDQSSKTVYLESEAKLFIQEMVKDKKIKLVWSYILEFENYRNPHIERRTAIQSWKDLASITIIENKSLLQNAEQIFGYKFGVKDSLHLACAIEANVDYFLTTDKGILKKKNLIPSLKIINPMNFITIIEEQP